MIELCREAGLPEPIHELRQGSFVIAVWKDWLTEHVVAGLGLNDRQMKALGHIKKAGRIASVDYQQITGATPKTAARDLEAFVAMSVLLRLGKKRGVHYMLAGRRMGQKSDI